VFRDFSREQSFSIVVVEEAMESMADGVLGKDILEQLITEDVGTIAETFQKMFISCVENVKKPNVLIAGITGMFIRDAA
jgi:hypothetical protein